MNNTAYDIDYLVENQTFLADVSAKPTTKAVPRSVPAPSLTDVQESLARELLQAASAHDEWVRYYTRATGTVQAAP